MDTQKLLKALDDESNEALMNFTTDKIRQLNLDILKELHLEKHVTLALLQKLNGYKYIDELNELKYGTFIRWIPIEDPENIELSRGAIFCNVTMTDQGSFCLCKSHGFPPKYFRISMDKNLIFQKLTNQEQVLLSVLDHLAK